MDPMEVKRGKRPLADVLAPIADQDEQMYRLGRYEAMRDLARAQERVTGRADVLVRMMALTAMDELLPYGPTFEDPS